MRKSAQKPLNRGFTLLEVLAVVAIASALAAVGFYGYQAARLRAHQSVSTTNLRQLASANLLYSIDHQSYCPHDLDGRNRIFWHGARSSTKTRFDPQKGLLAEYLGSSRQVGKCPQLERMIDASAFNESGAGGYGYNDAYVGGTNGDNSKPNRPAAVNNPARTLMFATTAFAVAGGIQEYSSAPPPCWVDANGNLGGPLQPSIHFRFNGRALVAWCDGHVSEEPPTGNAERNIYGGDNEKTRIDFCGPAENNGWWNPRN